MGCRPDRSLDATNIAAGGCAGRPALFRHTGPVSVRDNLRLLGFFVAAVVVLAACTGSEESAAPAGPKLDPEPRGLQTISAAAMGEVQSVRFSLSRTGAPVFIDAAEAISLESLEGVFSSPASAEAELKVLVNQSLGTKIGAVAIDEEIWLSNPVTGKFETLPPGFDIDPSSFFDPKGAWQPLLEKLTDVSFIAEEDRDGEAYHITGTAPEEQIRSITAGLVRGEDVVVDLWLDPSSGLVKAIEFETSLAGEPTQWELTLSDYGESFEIRDPTLGQ